MATKPTDTEEIMHIEEDSDGTVTIDLPDSIRTADDEPAEPRKAADDDGDVDHPNDSEAVRAARRARRRSKKDLIRKTNDEKDVRLQMLQRQNDDLTNRLSNVERKTQQHDINRLDKAIEDQSVRLEYAKMKLSEATASGDGDSAVNAQELLYEARQQLDQLNASKRNANQAPQQKQIDPSVQRHAATWIDRNDWYKPDLSDTDSKVAKQIDETLVKDGWNPGTAEYWDELDNRLQKYLPHRYNKSNERSESSRSPRNTVGSSGREASAAYGGTNRTFTLSAEQVRAMKDAGMWEDPAKRARMVKRYATESRNNKGN